MGATWMDRCNSAPYNRNAAGVHASMACCVCGGGAEDDISRGSSFATPSFNFFFITTTSSVSHVPSISYVSAYLESCSACVPGKYKSIASTIACANCEAGTYSAYLASVTCTGCPTGRESPASSESHTSCICSAGFHQAEDMHGEPCDPCPAGTFKAARGSSGCQRCDPGAPPPLFACSLAVRGHSLCVLHMILFGVAFDLCHREGLNGHGTDFPRRLPSVRSGYLQLLGKYRMLGTRHDVLAIARATRASSLCPQSHAPQPTYRFQHRLAFACVGCFQHRPALLQH